MKTFSVWAFALSLCLLLTSCEVESDHPLSSPRGAQVDHRLIGDWVDKTDADPETYRFSSTNSHWMHVEVIPAKPGKKAESYDMFQTVIEGETYLNVRVMEKGATHYQFTRYIINDDGGIEMWAMSDDAAAAAVRAGKLKGTVDELYDHSKPRPLHPDVDVTLHDSGENIAGYIASANIYALFSEKMHVLTRVK